MIGQIRALELELIVSIATSQMGGFASSPGVLIIARIFQGMRAALADPSVLATAYVAATAIASVSALTAPDTAQGFRSIPARGSHMTPQRFFGQ